MKNSRFVTTLRRIHQRLNGSTVEYNLTRYFSSLREIGRYEATLKTKTDRQLEQLSRSLSVRARQGATLDALLVESYALVREAVSRTLQLDPYDVQMIGAMAIHEGKVAEMETGEGKTLTAVFPSYLNGLTRRGVHVLTFNDYLARRDAEWMGPVYRFLGMTVGYVQEGMTGDERRRAYSADIMYATAKEAGFDYLRDTLCRSQRNGSSARLTLQLSMRPIRSSSTRPAFPWSLPAHGMIPFPIFAISPKLFVNCAVESTWNLMTRPETSS